VNLIAFLTSALDGSCQIHFSSVDSRNVRQGARFAPQQSGCFREAKIFRPLNGSNIGIVQYTH
jgi:hypothetical protein